MSVSQNTKHSQHVDNSVSPTDLDLLVQACRNVKDMDELEFISNCGQRDGGIGCSSCFYAVIDIRAEYNRLIRLKKKRKKAT